MEEFRDIPGYEGLYQVSNIGRVKRVSRYKNNGRGTFISKEKILIQQRNRLNSYYCVRLNMKPKNVHQLVAMAFLNHTPCGYKLVVDHINNDKLDNRVENLQVVTTRFNTSKYFSQKNTTSKYIGVCLNKERLNWKATIVVNKKNLHLGYFNCELAAHIAYKKALVTLNNGEEIQFKTRSSSSEYKGVRWDKAKNKWRSGIWTNGKLINLGSFNCELEAHQSYKKALEDFNNGKEITRNIKKPTSKYKGVSFCKKSNKWRSRVMINGKENMLGLFEKEYDAHVAYQNKLLSLSN